MLSWVEESFQPHSEAHGENAPKRPAEKRPCLLEINDARMLQTRSIALTAVALCRSMIDLHRICCSTMQLMHVCDIWGTLAEAVGQPLHDPVAARVGLPPLDTISFWSIVLGNKTAALRQGLLVDNVYWDNTGLKIHSGGGNAIWQSDVYPNASTNFSENAAVDSNCNKKGCLFDVVHDMVYHAFSSSGNVDTLSVRGLLMCGCRESILTLLHPGMHLHIHFISSQHQCIFEGVH